MRAAALERQATDTRWSHLQSVDLRRGRLCRLCRALVRCLHRLAERCKRALHRLDFRANLANTSTELRLLLLNLLRSSLKLAYRRVCALQLIRCLAHAAGAELRLLIHTLAQCNTRLCRLCAGGCELRSERRLSGRERFDALIELSELDLGGAHAPLELF